MVLKADLIEEFDNAALKDLNDKITVISNEFHVFYKAKNIVMAVEKLYEILQLYSIKDRKVRIGYVDKRQIDILITLYHKLANKEDMVIYNIPCFSWR
jgi:hypothetical protein